MANLAAQITQKGIEETLNSVNTGLAVTLTHIALGDEGYSATGQELKLKNEIVRYKIADGKRESQNRLHINCIADGPSNFLIREVGVFTSTGTLFALYASADALAEKPKNAEFILSFDLTLAGFPANSVTVEGNGERLNLALAKELAQLSSAILDLQKQNLELSSRIVDLETRA
jgi:hypothetical protein